MERCSFRMAIELVKEGCGILESARAQSNHPGYFPRYICRLEADLYNTLGSIEYESNRPGHGRIWFEKANAHRERLLGNDTYEAFDIQTMAIVDANIGLSYLADGETFFIISSCEILLSTFEDQSNRNEWASNLSIAYRLKGDLQKSWHWCEKAYAWTKETYGDDSLNMAR